MTTNNENDITLRIKSNTHPNEELTVKIPPSYTVIKLKESICSTIGSDAKGRYMRLIANGRLLVPDKANIEDFRLNSGSVVHAVIAEDGVRGGKQAALAHATIPLLKRDRNLTNNGNEDEEDVNDLEAGTSRFGFDRLMTNDRTRNDIDALRSYFSQQVDRFILQRNINNNNTNSESNIPNLQELTPLERLHMEEQWMETQGPLSEFRLNLNTTTTPIILPHRRLFSTITNPTNTTTLIQDSQTLIGTDKDLIWGFILGFFVGFIMLFWVWIPHIPHKQKLGIMLGLCFQIGLNYLNGGSSE